MSYAEFQHLIIGVLGIAIGYIFGRCLGHTAGYSECYKDRRKIESGEYVVDPGGITMSKAKKPCEPKK